MRSLIAVAAAVFTLAGNIALAYEQPDYNVISQTEDYEVRRYEPFVIAETTVRDDFDGAGSQAFGILAGYIFGKNDKEEKMAMTAPVISSVGENGTERPGDYEYAFVMEKKYTPASLPLPDDSRIEIRTVPERILAVRRYSGRWTEKNYRKHETRLLQALAADGVATRGEPMLARYNGPFTPWFLRRNEVMIEIEDKTLDASQAESSD